MHATRSSHRNLRAENHPRANKNLCVAARAGVVWRSWDEEGNHGRTAVSLKVVVPRDTHSTPTAPGFHATRSQAATHGITLNIRPEFFSGHTIPGPDSRRTNSRDVDGSTVGCAVVASRALSSRSRLFERARSDSTYCQCRTESPGLRSFRLVRRITSTCTCSRPENRCPRRFISRPRSLASGRSLIPGRAVTGRLSRPTDYRTPGTFSVREQEHSTHRTLATTSCLGQISCAESTRCVARLSSAELASARKFFLRCMGCLGRIFMSPWSILGPRQKTRRDRGSRRSCDLV